MDYILELARIRDLMHREIIRTMIADNRNHFDYILKFNHPIECEVRYHRRTSHSDQEPVIITGVDSNNNELVAHSPSGENRFVFYSDLSMEDLAYIHKSVVTKNYIISLDNT